MKALFRAILPGWRGPGLSRLPFPGKVRVALALSIAAAWLLCPLLTRRGLGLGAPVLLGRLVYHRWWPLRVLVQWWKTVAVLTAER